MKRKRDLIVTNILSLLVVLGAWLAGWREAALFGLAVLAVMDLLAVLRERLPQALFRREKGPAGPANESEGQPPALADPGQAPAEPEEEQRSPDEDQ